MPGSTKFVRQHFYETVEHKATSRQLSAVPHQVRREAYHLKRIQSTVAVLAVCRRQERSMHVAQAMTIPDSIYCMGIGSSTRAGQPCGAGLDAAAKHWRCTQDRHKLEAQDQGQQR